MKRTMRFLGSGAGDFVTEESQGNKTVCDQKDAQFAGKNLRRATSSLLGDEILIDFHSDIVLRENQVDPDRIHHILITHGHFDHFNPAEICKLATQLSHPLNIYCNATVAHSMRFAAKYQWEQSKDNFIKNESKPNFNLIIIKPYESFFIDYLRITPVAANHMIQKQYMLSEQQALNFIFECDNTTIFYALDSSYVLPETMTFLKNYQFDICVFDGTFGFREVDTFVSGHMNFQMLAKTRDNFQSAGILKPNAQIYADHISIKYADIESHEHAAQYLKDQDIILAYDGMEVELPGNT